jgi:glycine/betaine/sarcosine/D-proline reductase family selenoprotein B
MAALYQVAETIGSNRIVKAEATTHPLGDPSLPKKKEKELRRRYVELALQVLRKDAKEKEVFLLMK